MEWMYQFVRQELILTSLCEKLARQNVIRSGGKIEKDDTGKEYFFIPVREAIPENIEQSFNPGPCNENNRYTNTEMDQISIKII